MSGCWLYILRCADGSYYVGTSRAEDLDTRVSQHQQGTFGGYTAKRRPVALVYSSHFDRIDEAVASERQIKGWARAKKEALIRGDFDALPGLSRRGSKQARGASSEAGPGSEAADIAEAVPPTPSS
jgi:putative endonuclease